MTTIASSHGPTEVINARRTESLDAPAILDLVSNRTVEQFGHVNIVHLIEKANLAVTLINEENEVLGFAGFLDYPPLPPEVCDSAKWEEWMRECGYPVIEKCTPLNSLFMHYFVAKSDYTIGCATEIVRTVFNAVPDLHFLFLTLKNNTKPEQALSQIFHPIEGKKDNERHVLFGCYRHAHVPVLHIRKAVVEDNDDLLPIFLRLNHNLTQTYGDHFLAEMIEAQDEDNHALVAEVGGKAIGFISMCSHVNINLLEKEYELMPFHGLRKPHPDDKLVDDTPPTPAQEEPQPAPSNPTPAVTAPEASPRQSENNMVKSSSEDTEQSDSPSVAEGMSPSGSVAEEEKQDSDINYLLPERDPTPVNEPEFEPQYFGESNCFSIQLFCIDELYEMRSADFLPQVFRLFPGKEFAVITVPHLVPEFPLLQHFVRVTPKNTMLVTQELYVFHRGGLLYDFNVRPVISKDKDQISTLVNGLSSNLDVMKDVEIFNRARRDDDGTGVQAFVAESLGQIVGVAVVRREEEIEYIRSHYNIEDFIYFNHHRRDEHGHLHHFCLNPVFQHYTKQFFKEILRQGHKSCLFYPVEKQNDSQNSKKHSLITGINYLVPVRARRQIIYPLGELKENAPSERIVKEMHPYALYHINRKLTLEPKVTINARIVVVGASTVGISFLETLSFCPHLRFNNLTLVSKDGLPDKIHSANYSYTEEQLACMSLSTWVNVVQGNMVGIERAHKYVILQNGEQVSYDYLMLCTGQQYQVPHPTNADIEEGATNHNIPSRAIEKPYLQKPPRNVMTVNKAMDEKQMMAWLTGIKDFCGKIIIYGNSLDAYFTLQSLLAHGISGKNLVLLQPPTTHKFTEPDTFQEPGLVKAVLEAMKDAGVEHHIDCIFADWVMDEKMPERVKEVSFTTPTKPIVMSCHALLSFYPKCIDNWTFKAVNDACLVFDGRLVIDSNFCTNDKSIRAAGPLTKYARRYHAEDWSNHDGYNSCEIGFRLAMSVLPIFDPTLEALIDEPENMDDPYTKLTPVFSDGKVFHGYLPGNFEYLHIRKPGPTQAYESQLANPNHGQEIETGSVENGNYFRLHVNQLNCIETITCVVKGDGSSNIPVTNYIQLFNIHERYLNNLVSRVEEGLVPDLFTYFREPWSMALFHDRFRDLRQEVRELLSIPPQGANISSLEAEVQQLIKEDLKISAEQRQMLNEFYRNTGMKKAVEKRLLSFLSYNYYHLPMYAKPGMV